MKPNVEEALRTLHVASHDMKASEILKESPEIHLSIVCFHAQQTIEKSLKAVLFLHRIEFRRTHDLTELAQLLRQHGIESPVADLHLNVLNPFAVTFRCDDMEINMITREEAADLAVIVYRWAENQVRSLVENEEKHDPAEE